MENFMKNLEEEEINNKKNYEDCDSISEFVYPSEADLVENKFYDAMKVKEGALSVSTGFEEYEFEFLFGLVERDLTYKLAGKGRKCKISPKDRFLLVLTYLKHNETVSRLAMFFEVTPCTVNLILNKTISNITQTLSQYFIVPMKKEEQLKNGIYFEHNPEVALVVDATVFEIQKPTGLFNDVKEFFSGKHFTYCLKVETAVLPNGMCAFVSKVYPGSVHDFTIYKERTKIYQIFLTKELNNNNLNHFENFTSWAILADKGYIGQTSGCRTITPPKHKSLAYTEKLKFNERSIIERFFGRAKMYFKILRSKFRGSRESFENIVKICFALTNYHLSYNPLTIKDSNFYNKLKEKIIENNKYLIKHAKMQGKYPKDDKDSISHSCNNDLSFNFK